MKDTFTKPKMVVFSSLFVSCGLGSIMLGWVTYFATEYLGLAAGTVGLLFMVSKFFDGFTDIVAGYIIDQTNSKMGKGRPYDLAQIGYWTTIVLLFVVPVMSIRLTYAWIFIMYTLANSVFWTLLNCASPVYMANVIDRPEQSVTANAIIGVISMIASTAGGIIIPQLAANVGTTRRGWAVIAIGAAIPSLLIGMMRFFIVKEKAQRKSTVEKFTFGDAWHAITHNKYIVLFSLIIFVSNVSSNLSANASKYYYSYVLGDVGLASIMSLTQLASIVSIVITPILSKKIGFIRFMRILTIVSVIGNLLRLINPYSVPLIFITGFFTGISYLTIWLYINTFIIDCIDYGEWNTGRRSEGTISCVQSVFAKVSVGVGTGMSGVLLGASGYNGSLTVQSDSTIRMLITLFIVIPAVFTVIQYVILRAYNLEDKLPQIRQELAERKEKSK